MRTTFLIFIALLMSGCGLLPRTGTPSQALLIADAMNIPATDISKEKYREILARRNATGDGRNTDNSVAGAAQLIASGDTTMFLLGGLTARSIAANIQYVAWVPEELAAKHLSKHR